jgi:lambda repressor-like predicted transcriptional regulator
MHPEDIKAAIRKNGSSQTAIARSLGVTPTTVYLVICGRTVSRRVAKKIASISGHPASQLWPGKYNDRRVA